MRIATTILSLDWKKAVNTYIPTESPVVRLISEGRDYFGRAFVVSDWYLTAYRPFRHNGEIVGMLFVGMPEKDMKQLQQIFSGKKFWVTDFRLSLIRKENI